MGALLQDLRYGLRKLARSPGFTTVAVATLALGIGANTAIFSAVNAVLLRPLPYAEPDRLVLIWNKMDATGWPKAPIAGPDLLDVRREAPSLAAVAAMNNVPEATLADEGPPEQIRVGGVTGEFFDVLGVQAMLGRTFVAGDDLPVDSPDGEEPPPSALVLAHAFWQRRFGGDRGVVGRSVRLGGRSMVIVGVMPADFALYMPADAGMSTEIDAWQPLQTDFAAQARDQQWMRVVARLAPGATLAAARAELAGVAERQRAAHAFHASVGMELIAQPMHGDVVGHVRPALLALSGAVAFVLLIACANVANLLLARATLRGREMAVRAALGAGRWRIARQVLTEGLLLSALGGVAGLGLALLGIRALTALRPPDLPRIAQVGLDGRVLAFTLAATALAAVFFGLAPAIGSALTGAADALRVRGEGARRGRLRSALVVVEVALSLLLLVGAGLLLRSFVELSRVRPGFDPRGVLTYKLLLPFREYPGVQPRVDFFARLEEKMAALPAVESVGAVFPLPLGGRFWTGPAGLPDQSPAEWAKNEVSFRVATPGYFSAMGIRLLDGRGLAAVEVAETRPVAVVDARLAERFWPGRPAVGQRLGVDVLGRQEVLEVVGVVEPVRHSDLARLDRETVYLPHGFMPWAPMSVVLRSATSVPAGLAGAVRSEVARLDPGLPVYDLAPMSARVREALAAARFTMVLTGMFAAVALALAAVGLFGVISYTVRQRTHEIGVRLALGAEPGRIVAWVVGRGLALTGLGIVLGLAASVPATRAMASLLYGVRPSDPATLTAVALLLAAVAAAAAWVPAQRAAAVDPTVSLRSE